MTPTTPTKQLHIPLPTLTPLVPAPALGVTTAEAVVEPSCVNFCDTSQGGLLPTVG